VLGLVAQKQVDQTQRLPRSLRRQVLWANIAGKVLSRDPAYLEPFEVDVPFTHLWLLHPRRQDTLLTLQRQQRITVPVDHNALPV